MAWPTIDTTVPLGTENMTFGDDRIRESKQHLVDALEEISNYSTAGATPALKMAEWDTAGRPAGANLVTGVTGYNTTLGCQERYDGANWDTVSLPPATDAEAIAGTETAKAISPATLRSGLNASGDAPVFACRMWVNFNGTGTLAVNGSGNVASVTDNGAGLYTITLTEALEDINYAIIANAGSTPGNAISCFENTNVTRTTSSFGIRVNNGGDSYDSTSVSVAVFR